MLIYGSSTISIDQQIIIKKKCLGCGSNDCAISAVQRYGHIWFLPLFPTKKIFMLSCVQCGSSLANEDIAKVCPTINTAYFKTPILSYVGWIIIAIIVAVTVLHDYATKNKLTNSTTNKVQTPVHYEIKNNYNQLKKHDFLILHDPKELGYLVARVLKIDESKDVTLTIQLSKWMYKKKTKLVDLIISNSTTPFDDNFYNLDYEIISIKELEQEFPMVNIITRKDNPRLLK